MSFERAPSALRRPISLRALHHRDEHDVGDHDRPHHERHARDDDRGEVGALRDRLPDRLHRARADDSEGVVGREAGLARRAEDRPDLVLHAVEPGHAALRAHQDREAPVGAQDLGEERDGNEDHLVARLAQHLAETLLHADDAHGIAVDEQGAVDRVEAGEDLVLHVGADDRDRGGVRLLARVEEAAGLEVEVEHGVDVGGVARDLDAAELAVPRLDGRGLARLRTHRGAGPAVGLDQPALGHGERLPAVREQELGAAPQDAVLGEDQDVGVEVHEVRRPRTRSGR